VDAFGALQDAVPQRRLVDPRRRPEVGLVDRYRAPPGDVDPLGAAGVGDSVLRDPHRVVVAEVEEGRHDADAVCIQLEAQLLGADAGEERARDRRQEAGAVARDAVGGDRLPGAPAGQAGQGEIDDLATRRAGGVRDEADAACIELRALPSALTRRAIEVEQPRDSSLPGGAVVLDPAGATTLSRKGSR